MTITDQLAEALRIAESVESLYLDLTADGRIDCRSDAAEQLCEAFQRFQDARKPALSAYDAAQSAPTSDGFTSADMATAAAHGFRNGATSVDRVVKDSLTTADADPVSLIVKLIADHVGHGMREKCEALAERIAALQPAIMDEAVQRDAARYRWIKALGTVELGTKPICVDDGAQLRGWEICVFLPWDAEPDYQCCGKYGVNENGQRDCGFCPANRPKLSDKAIDAYLDKQSKVQP